MMLEQDPMTHCDFRRHSGPVAAGTTDIEPTGEDLAGFEGVTFVALFGTLTSGAVTSIKIQESADNVTFTDITGASLTIPQATGSNKAAVVGARIHKRYARCVVDRGTANAVLDTIIAIPWGARSRPVTPDADTINTSYATVRA